MKRVRIDKVIPGDIILTASKTLVGKGIRATTFGAVSHAIICAQHSSIIDSTANGVQARNLQREFFKDSEDVFAFRLREPLDATQLAHVINYARSAIGTRYSTREAVRSVAAVKKPRSERQFCSRLVARAYANAGIQLVPDKDYCTPDDLRKSPLLVELTDIIEFVTDAEVAAWQKRDNPLERMKNAQNAVLDAARLHAPKVETFEDIYELVRDHPEYDQEIAEAFRQSGYLDLWRHDLKVNSVHYDIGVMEAATTPSTADDLRTYCVDTIKEASSGGVRFAINLIGIQRLHGVYRRQTYAQLIELYEVLLRTDQLRRNTAIEWLRRHHPEDIDKHFERIAPHSEQWFSIVDQVEPNLAALARGWIAAEGKATVCSSCGDPAHDYRLANSAEAMPGVPSLRLCDDCVKIRRGYGEILEPFETAN